MTLRHITWQTEAPIPLSTGDVIARGEASPQVRDSAKAAAIGDADALAAHIQAMIARSLTEVFQGIEPSADQLTGLREDIASAALVAANMKLRGVGVILLDLSITAMEFADLPQSQ